jgi:succinate dehydrogenase / fumarate reductase membrane anchor subunit
MAVNYGSRRTVVGAHYGVRDWLAQRATAVILAVYVLLLVALVIGAGNVDYAAWRNLFAPQWMKLATFLAVISLCWHAWIGMRNIFMDYVKNMAARMLLYVVAICWLIVCAAWSAQILWSV